jgi:hypothetical protein
VVFIIDGSGSNEEAGNLTALMAKALGDGGWRIVRDKGTDAALSEPEKLRGILCDYPKESETVAEDLVSVLEEKGLRIQCRRLSDDPLSIMFIAVGLNE